MERSASEGEILETLTLLRRKEEETLRKRFGRDAVSTSEERALNFMREGKRGRSEISQ